MMQGKECKKYCPCASIEVNNVCISCETETSVGVSQDGKSCKCKNGYIWNPKKAECFKPSIDFQPPLLTSSLCNNVQFGAGPAENGEGCNCQPGYKWNAKTSQCTKNYAGLILGLIFGLGLLIVIGAVFIFYNIKKRK